MRPFFQQIQLTLSLSKQQQIVGLVQTVVLEDSYHR
jgi:hypothetical protein